MSIDEIEKAVVLSKSGNKEEARDLLKRVLEKDPGNEVAYLWYVDTMANNDAQRIEALEQFLATYPQSAQVRSALDQMTSRGVKRSSPPARRTEAPDAPKPISEPAIRSERFVQQPVSVSPRFPPGSVPRMLMAFGLFAAWIALLVMLLLPIWSGTNFFSLVSRSMPTLVARLSASPEKPLSTAPLPLNSILYADLSLVCVLPEGIRDGYIREEPSPDGNCDQLKSYELIGLQRYFCAPWSSASVQRLTCELLVYDSPEATLLAFSGMETDPDSAGEQVGLPDLGEDILGYRVVGSQFFYLVAYRDGRLIVKVTSISADGNAAFEVLQPTLQYVSRQLMRYDLK